MQITRETIEQSQEPDRSRQVARAWLERVAHSAQPLRNAGSRRAIATYRAVQRLSPAREQSRQGSSGAEFQLDPRSRSVEAIYQSTIGAGYRVIAVIAIEHGDGASAVAQALARRSALVSNQTLLVDASAKAGSAPTEAGSGVEPFTRLELRPDADCFVHRSKEFLRALWAEDPTQYDAIVIDCAPALAHEDDAIPGAISARSADAVVLVGGGGAATRDSIGLAKAAIGEANTVGIVVNGRDQPTVGAEIAREALRLAPIFPSLARNIAERAKRWGVLDVPA